MMWALFVVLSLFCSSALAIASCKSNAQLTLYSEMVEQRGVTIEKSFVNRSVPVSLTYDVQANDLVIDSMIWEHNGQAIVLDENSKKDVYYSIEKGPNNLLIDLNCPSPTARVTGNWTLTLKTGDSEEHVAVCFINSAPLFQPRLGAVRTNEGQPLSLTCEVETYPLPSELVWYHVKESETGNKLTPVSDVTFKAKDGVKNAVMEWADSTNATGFYVCAAKSGNDNLMIEVRVKDKTTYLWPCIGILLELIVLAVTIGFYERAQYKKRKADKERAEAKGEK